MTIWKYQLNVTDSQVLSMPAGSKALSCQFQGDRLCLWAAVDPTQRSEDRRVYVIGTGHSVPSIPLTFIGTVQMMGGALIYHVFMGEK